MVDAKKLKEIFLDIGEVIEQNKLYVINKLIMKIKMAVYKNLYTAF